MNHDSEELPFVSSSTAPQNRPILPHPDILRRVYHHGATKQLKDWSPSKSFPSIKLPHFPLRPYSNPIIKTKDNSRSNLLLFRITILYNASDATLKYPSPRRILPSKRSFQKPNTAQSKKVIFSNCKADQFHSSFPCSFFPGFLNP